MLPLFRALFFVAGAFLFLVPLLGALYFGYSVGDKMDGREILRLVWATFPFGAAIGSGLLLVGVPRLVVGNRRRFFQILAGLLIALSVLITTGITKASLSGGFYPALMLIEFAAFYIFVWPAKHYSVVQNAADSVPEDRSNDA